jgi:hypothetical protein
MSNLKNERAKYIFFSTRGTAIANSPNHCGVAYNVYR